jgi:hypothetical protein
MTAEPVAAQRIPEPGRYDLPEEQYHRDPMRWDGGSLSSTIARKLLPPSVPALAKYAMDHPEHKDCYDLGSVTHKLTLGSGCPIVEVPADSWSTKAAREAREAARADGAVALLAKDLARAHAMAGAVHADPLAHALLTAPGKPEQTLIWWEGDIWGRAMLDRWPDPDADNGFGPPTIVDLKTTEKGLDDASIAKTVWEYGYHVPEDWYRRGYHAVHGVWPDFILVFVHTKPPHLVRVITLDDVFRDDARVRNNNAIKVWRDCTTTGQWPGYTNDLTPISPPRWAYTMGDYTE